MTFPQLSLWLWSSTLCNEFRNVFRAGEEIDNRDSYMPYLMELQLSSKSPYSTVVNPNIHYFVHVVGCTFSYDRSKHARMVGEYHAGMTYNNAVLMSYVFMTFGEYKQMYSRSKNPRRVADMDAGEKRSEEGAAIKMPAGIGPNDWLAYFRDKQGAIEPKIEERVKMAWAALRDTRDGTIGAHLLGIGQSKLPELSGPMESANVPQSTQRK